ncbi:MAG: hypothetical protein FJ403_22600 [Verrucomicrobia bacterium]|nr:hypothetical protein [Verrucomicrobiota bacterium]
MKVFQSCFSVAAVVCLLLSGCGSKETSPEPTAAAPSTPASAQDNATPAGPAEAISAARSSLKAGKVDEAAAKLAQLQLQRASFNAQQAKDYRQALSEAYDRAIEAMQRGDPNAQATLQLLRAAQPR